MKPSNKHVMRLASRLSSRNFTSWSRAPGSRRVIALRFTFKSRKSGALMVGHLFSRFSPKFSPVNLPVPASNLSKWLLGICAIRLAAKFTWTSVIVALGLRMR